MQSEPDTIVHTHVLVIDDNPVIGAAMEKADGLLSGVKIHYANDFNPGLTILRAHPEITVGVLDVHLHRYRATDDGYVARMRKEFHGTLIGTSANEMFEKDMIKAGCDRFIHKGDVGQDRLLDFIMSLPNASTALIYKAPYVDRWRKAIANSMLLLIPETIDEMMGNIRVKGDRLKLVVLPEEEFIPPSSDKEDTLAQTHGDPLLLEKMVKAGFTGRAILTRMRQKSQLPSSVLQDGKVELVNRTDVEEYLKKSVDVYT